jgi:predicted DNA-binding protein
MSEHNGRITFTFQMSPELWEPLVKAAADDDRTKAYIVNKALERYLQGNGYLTEHVEHYSRRRSP